MANRRSGANKKKTAKKKAAKKKAASKKAVSKKAAKKKAGKKKTAKKKATKKAANKRKAANKPAKKKAGKKKAGAKKTKAGAKKAGSKKASSKKATSKKATSKKAGGKKTGATKTGKRTANTLEAIKRAADKSKPKIRPKSAIKVGTIPPAPASSKRNFGLRGAAPWVARHAAKHAEELRKRNAQPPPPGSARATLRVPEGAEEIKKEVGQLMQVTSQVRQMRKRLDKNFYEIGQLLDAVQQDGLYEAKGYSTFESFLDREIDLPRSVSLRLIRITHTFHRETAYDFGIDRLTSALAALDGEVMQAPPSHPSSRGWSQAALPPKPPIRFDD